LTSQEQSSKFIVAEHTAEYYSSGVREYVDKLIRIFTEKDTETIKALKHTIDAFLQMPIHKKTEKSIVLNATEQDTKIANVK